MCNNSKQLKYHDGTNGTNVLALQAVSSRTHTYPMTDESWGTWQVLIDSSSSMIYHIALPVSMEKQKEEQPKPQGKHLSKKMNMG